MDEPEERPRQGWRDYLRPSISVMAYLIVAIPTVMIVSCIYDLDDETGLITVSGLHRGKALVSHRRQEPPLAPPE